MAISVSKHLIPELFDDSRPHLLCYLLWDGSTQIDNREYYLGDAMKSANMGVRHAYTASYIYMLKDDHWTPLKNRSANGAETEYVFEHIFGEGSVVTIKDGLKVFIDPKRLLLVKLKTPLVDNRRLVK